MSKSIFISKGILSNQPVKRIINLGMHPYADTFVSKNQLNLNEPCFPLECYLCARSGHIQLGFITNDYDRYNLYSYSYTSSNSSYARDHWTSFYESTTKKYNLYQKLILEIGSNDGYLLSKYQKNNRVLGVDSSKEMVELSMQKNSINAINDIFSLKLAQSLKKKYKKFDFIIANNVLNHSNNPIDFVKGINTILSPNGIFVYEIPYWGETIRSLKFDQIYHEHISYFTIKSSDFLLRSQDMEIISISKNEYHGGSIRIFSRLKQKNNPFQKQVNKFIEEEEDSGLFCNETYKKFQKDIELKRDRFLATFFKARMEGVPIIGIGAAAKANTFLNFYGLNSTMIDFITDASDIKVGKYTPLTRIEIKKDIIFKNYQSVYALILSWNISETLKKKILKINSKVKFL